MISRGYAPIGWREHPRYRWLLPHAVRTTYGPALTVSANELKTPHIREELERLPVAERLQSLIRVHTKSKQSPPISELPNEFGDTNFLLPLRVWESTGNPLPGAPPVAVDLGTFEAAPNGPEAFAYRSHLAGLAGVATRHDQWTKGLVALFHRFEVPCWATDVLVERELTRCDAIGIDIVVIG